MSPAPHRAVVLLAFVDDEFDESLVGALSEMAADLAGSRSWTVGPPEVVDETDELGVRTLGLVHQVYPAFGDEGALLDDATDRALLDEVRVIVSQLEALSESAGVDFGLELDGNSVGWVEQGARSNDLQVGLLDAWAERFA